MDVQVIVRRSHFSTSCNFLQSGKYWLISCIVLVGSESRLLFLVLAQKLLLSCDMPEYAYLTGGASGLGAATARMLAKKGMKVFIADRDQENGRKIAQEIGGEFAPVDLADWNSQVKAFTQAVSAFGRLDYVYGIGGIDERRWLPNNSASTSGLEFEKPDLAVIDVDLTGVLYTSALAVQQARRQDVGQHGFRCKSEYGLSRRKAC